MEKQIEEIIVRLQKHEERIAALEGSRSVAKTEPAEISEDLPLLMANKVGDCEESETIQTKVLDPKNPNAKVLLCFYVSYKYFDNAWLTSGDIERITSQLGVKISTSNASTRLKELRPYLETGKARKNGQPTPCRLNRNGAKYFEQLLHS